MLHPVLHLIKKELKRQCKLCRREKQRELQDLQAAGLVAAPEPLLTLQNFIRVLGDQAFLDPSKHEQKGCGTDTGASSGPRTTLHVALFFVKDLGHPYHRVKLDLNGQLPDVSLRKDRR